MTYSRLSAPVLLSGISERPRLMARLDVVLAESRALWLAGPPGAGKTTVIAAYAGYRQLPCLWYQLDAADAEPATFFQYLAAAADVIAPGAGSLLPRLTPEYLRGLPAFTRRFSEILFERLPSHGLLVFDNCQELPADSAVYALLEQMLGNAGPHQNFVFVSRETPPAQLARLQVNRQLHVLGWDEIRFTPEECDEFLVLDGGIDEAAAHEIKQAANGWIAGLILMKRTGGRLPGAKTPYADHQLIFDYFALEIVRHLPEEIHRMLLRASLFKLFTPAMLARLCDMDESRVTEILARLHAQQFFVGRDRGDSPHYQLHPLFRHYLISGCGKLNRDDFLKLQRRAAALALDDGQLDAAVELMLECEDWEQLAGLCLSNAQQLLQAGRNKSLLDWMSWLPPELLEGNPWLVLWYGCAQIPYEPGRALEKFEQAYGGFKAAGDVMGRYMAWAFAVEGLNFSWGDFTSAPFWLDEYEQLQTIAPRLPPELEVRILPALLTLLIWAEGGIARFPDLVKRCYELLRVVTDPSAEALLAGSILYYHTHVSADSEKSEELIDRMHARIVHGTAAPLFKLFWYALFTVNCVYMGKYEEGEESTLQALRLIEESGARVLEAALLCQSGWMYILRKDLKNTEAMLRRAEQVVVPERHVERMLYLLSLGGRNLLADDLPGARSALEEGYRLSVATAATLPRTSMASLLCYLHQRRGEPEQARPYIDFLETVAAASGSPVVGLQSRLLKCGSISQSDGEEYRRELTEILQYAIRNRIVIGPAHVLSVEERCRDALRYGIERDYVVKVIRRMQLRPGDEEDYYPDWPWLIRITTLGGLRIEVGGNELLLSKKQKRVLELLTLLIVSHREAMSKERIKSVIWPEADPGKAEQNFRSTLRRLRWLLSHDAVLWKEGAVSLNKKIMWVDCWELESLLRRHGESAGETGARIFELYRGRLLPGENHSWLLAEREQLHRKCCAVFLESARSLLEAGDADAALSALNRALEVDPTFEGFYQLQMQALIRKGLYAEAVKSYQSCVSVLSAQLKILPSAETKRIFESIPRT